MSPIVEMSLPLARIELLAATGTFGSLANARDPAHPIGTAARAVQALPDVMHGSFFGVEFWQYMSLA